MARYPISFCQLGYKYKRMSLLFYCFGRWDRQKAVEYMMNYTAYAREATEIEVDRYVTWPGQACAYKLGEIKIKELRKKAETRLGLLS